MLSPERLKLNHGNPLSTAGSLKRLVHGHAVWIQAPGYSCQFHNLPHVLVTAFVEKRQNQQFFQKRKLTLVQVFLSFSFGPIIPSDVVTPEPAEIGRCEVFWSPDALHSLPGVRGE